MSYGSINIRTHILKEDLMTALERDVVKRVEAALQLPMPARLQFFEALAQAAIEADRVQAAARWNAEVDALRLKRAA